MAKVYFSYNQRDRDFVVEVAERLKTQGHELTLDIEALSAGQDWRRALTEGLKSSEIFVVFLSRNSLESQFVLSEIGAFSGTLESLCAGAAELGRWADSRIRVR